MKIEEDRIAVKHKSAERSNQLTYGRAVKA